MEFTNKTNWVRPCLSRGGTNCVSWLAGGRVSDVCPLIDCKREGGTQLVTKL